MSDKWEGTGLEQQLRDVREQVHMQRKTYEGFMGTMHVALAITEEAGEVAGQLKKAWRDEAMLTNERQQAVKLELGDLLYYLQMMADRLGTSLDELAMLNVEKLKARRAKGAK